MESNAAPQAIIVTAVVVGCGSLLYFAFWLAKIIWPDKSKWVGCVLDSIEPFEGEEATKWITYRPQQIGDSFILDIQKKPNKAIQTLLKVAAKIFKNIWYWNYGKARVIDQIQFMRGDYSAAAYPIRWATTIQRQEGILPDWERREQTASSFGENILIKLDRPEKVTHIAIEILEPRPNQHWAVGEIKIREVRLFGKYWRVNIK